MTKLRNGAPAMKGWKTRYENMRYRRARELMREKALLSALSLLTAVRKGMEDFPDPMAARGAIRRYDRVIDQINRALG